VLALTLVSLALRTRQLNFYYWIDEAISVGISSHPLAQLPHLLREDGSPPLYYLLLHVWMQVFGHDEVATHWLSLVFALITVPVSYWGGSSLFGRRAGLMSAILAAGVPFITSYAQETRMYSLLLLLSLLVAISFVHAFVFARRRYLPLFSLSMAAALYTHNWALFMGVATFIAFLFCVWQAPEHRRVLLRDGLIGFGLAALLYVPWLPTLLYQAKRTGAPWALPPVLWSLSQGFYFITGGRGAAVALLLGAATGLITLRALGRAERIPQVTTAVLGILSLGTVLIAFAYAKTTPAWSGRYLAVIVGPLILLVGFGLSRARGLGIAALALVCCFWVLDPRATNLSAKSNVAAVAAVVRPHTGPTTLALSTQPEQVPAISYYLPRITRFATPLGPVPDPRVMDWRNALQRFRRSSVNGVLAPMIRSLRPGDRVLLVIPGSYQTAPLWMKLIHSSSKSWRSYLLHDRRLKLYKNTSPHQFADGLPVRGYLFLVRR
jgi:4-amino-4-deoxy-L-arabinose transferase-like glycosyltransferase